MRLLAFVLPTLLGLAASKYVQGQAVDFNTYDVGQCQKLVFQLFDHVTDVVAYPEIQDVANKFSFEQYAAKFTRPDVVKNFVRLFKFGLYPRTKFFSMYDNKQFYEMKTLFQVLFYAKDFDTFIRVACFARVFVNEGIFLRAFTVALRQREDCANFFIPAPYEVYPFFYTFSNTIETAQRFQFNRGVINPAFADAYGIIQLDKNSFVVEENSTNFAGSPQDKFRYFTDDIDLNAYYTFFRYDFPSFVGEEIFPSRRDRRGEYYFFFYQQLVARYFQEGLRHGICEIPELNYQFPIKYGYSPQIATHQGFVLPSRSSFYTIANQFNFDEVSFVEAFENNVREALFQGYFVMRDGVKVDLRNPLSIEALGRIFYEFINAGSYEFASDYVDFAFKQFFYSPSEFSSAFTLNYEFALRDPFFFIQVKHLISFFNFFKTFVPKYSHEELIFPGVKIENFDTNKLVTYFEDFDFDVSNAVYLNNEELQAGAERTQVFVRKQRLNHKPFSFTFDFVSDKAVDSVVRVFMGPKYDCFGNEFKFSNNFFNFMEIDSFNFQLKVGKNNFVRNSFDFNTKPVDCITSGQFFKNFASAGKNFPTNYEKTEKCTSGFPDRLILPQGTVGGYEMRFVVVVSPVSGFPDKDVNCVKTRSTYCFDNRAFGFPFDRYFDDTCFVPNIIYKDFFIYHEVSEVRKNTVAA